MPLSSSPRCATNEPSTKHQPSSLGPSFLIGALVPHPHPYLHHNEAVRIKWILCKTIRSGNNPPEDYYYYQQGMHGAWRGLSQGPATLGGMITPSGQGLNPRLRPIVSSMPRGPGFTETGSILLVIRMCPRKHCLSGCPSG